MRQSKLTTAGIQAAEEKEDNRRRNRKNGYSMMDIRDQGWARLSNGAVMCWPVDKDKRAEWGTYHDIPPGQFLIYQDGKYTPYEVDEFQKYLRWA